MTRPAVTNERHAPLIGACRYTQITMRSEATIVLIIKNLIIKFLINRFGRRTLTFLTFEVQTWQRHHRNSTLRVTF